jgi:aminoglycoside phosphotransferase (APT) family kinase protein
MSADIALPLRKWLQSNLAPEGELTIHAIDRPKGGFSADTLLVKAAAEMNGRRRDLDLVVRLERTGRDVFLDTDIGRQGEMMRALAAHAIAVPVVLGIERDRSLLGGQFLVMERIAAHSLPQHPSYQVAGLLHDLPPDRRGTMWRDAIAVIGRINRLDWRDGFAFLDKRQYGEPGLNQYLGWLEAWRSKVTGGRPHPVIDTAMAFLAEKQPTTDHIDVLWGDSNPGNMLFRDDGSVAAVLDFEAAALGPAEIDLGWWFFVDEMLSLGVPRLEGLPDRAAQIAAYEKALGRPIADLAYYEMLAGIRMSLVVVRTVGLLVDSGRLAASTRAGLDNPVVHMLARKLGIECGTSIDDYMEFVGAMNRR